MSAKPTVVLLPGLGFTASVMQPLRQHCESIFDSVIVDYETDSFQAWLIDCEKQLPKKIHLVGWSLGGLLAWKLAQHFPERVLSIAAFSSSPRFLATDDWPGVLAQHWQPFLDFSQREKMQKQLLRLQGDRQAVRELKGHLICMDPPHKAGGVGDEAHPLRPPACPEDPIQSSSWQWGLQMLAQCDEREWLQQTSTPVRLFLAANDAMLPVAELVPLINATVIPGAGHACVYTHPQACFELLQEFWHEH